MEDYTLGMVLESGECVHVDTGAGLAIMYNGSATFNVYQTANSGSVPPLFNHVTTFTNFNATSGTAPGIASEWLRDAQENHDF